MFSIKKLLHFSYNGYKYLNISIINNKLLTKNLKENIIENNFQFVKYLSTDDKKSINKSNNEENDENSDEDNNDLELPPLMKFEPKGMPNIFHALRNYFIINFQLKPLIDKNFNLHTFLNGAKQALTVISSNLANDNIEALKGLVVNEALEEITKNLSNFTPSQKQQLKVLIEDILLCFAYSIQIEGKTDAPNKTIVKILVVYDCVQNIDSLIKEEIQDPKAPIFNFNKYFDRKYLCNYEFIREYSKGEESDWIVNKLLHIKDKDLLKQFGLFK